MDAPLNFPLWIQLVLGIACAVLSAVGDVLIFDWAKHSRWYSFATGGTLWLASLLVMGLLFRFSQTSFSILVVLMVILHVVIDLGWDVGVLGKRMSWIEWTGFGFAIGSVVLLSLGGKR